MSKLIITADIHGNYTSWLAIKALLKNGDGLVVAGDLFDNRYGNHSHPDFDPGAIRRDLKDFSHPFFYVYGNCDTASFFPGFSSQLEFEYRSRQICLVHGHQMPACNTDPDIFIFGHTHLCRLEEKDRQIILNPGTITSPRNNRYTYGVIDDAGVFLVDLKTGKKIVSLAL